MEVVRTFNNELSSLYEVRPPVSRAKMALLTKYAIKAIKYYKHVVLSVEKFITKCKPEYKVPGLYVIDSVVRQSRHQYGPEKDMFAPRFTKNIVHTFQNLFKCPPAEKSKVVRVLNLWQKNSVFPIEVIQALMDLAVDPADPDRIAAAQTSVNAVLHSQGKPRLTVISTDGHTKASSPVAAPQSRANEVPEPNSTESILNAQSDMLNTVTKLLQQSQEPQTLSQQQQQLQELQLLQQQLMQQTQLMTQPEQEDLMIDSNLLAQIQTLTNQLLQKDTPPKPPEPAFNTKLLDFDYGESDDEDDRKENNPQGGVPNLLTEPAIWEHIQQMSATIQKTEELKSAQEKLRQELLQQQQEEFDHQINQAPNQQMNQMDPAINQMHQPSNQMHQPSNQMEPPLNQMHHMDQPMNQMHQSINQMHQPMHQQMNQVHQPMNQDLIELQEPVNYQIPPPPLQQHMIQQHVQMPPPPLQMHRQFIPMPLMQQDIMEIPHEEDTDMGDVIIVEEPEVQIDMMEDDRMRSRSSHRSRDKSRSRSPKRRRRSRSRDKRRRSRSRDRHSRRSRSRDREDRDRKHRREQREHESERKKKGLPPIKENCLTVCTTTVWLGHLSNRTTENEVREEIERYGTIRSIHMIPPRGCAFVCMETRYEAAKVLSKLQGLSLNSSTVRAAFAPGQGIKEARYKDMWDVERGATYIPWDKLPHNTKQLLDGGFIDEDTVPEHLKGNIQLEAGPDDFKSPANDEQDEYHAQYQDSGGMMQPAFDRPFYRPPIGGMPRPNMRHDGPLHMPFGPGGPQSIPLPPGPRMPLRPPINVPGMGPPPLAGGPMPPFGGQPIPGVVPMLPPGPFGGMPSDPMLIPLPGQLPPNSIGGPLMTGDPIGVVTSAVPHQPTLIVSNSGDTPTIELIPVVSTPALNGPPISFPIRMIRPGFHMPGQPTLLPPGFNPNLPPPSFGPLAGPRPPFRNLDMEDDGDKTPEQDASDPATATIVRDWSGMNVNNNDDIGKRSPDDRRISMQELANLELPRHRPSLLEAPPQLAMDIPLLPSPQINPNIQMIRLGTPERFPLNIIGANDIGPMAGFLPNFPRQMAPHLFEHLPPEIQNELEDGEIRNSDEENEERDRRNKNKIFRDSNGILGPRFQGARFDGPRFNGPRFDGPRFDGPRFDGPRFDGLRFERPRFDGPRFDGPRWRPMPLMPNDPTMRPMLGPPPGTLRGPGSGPFAAMFAGIPRMMDGAGRPPQLMIPNQASLGLRMGIPGSPGGPRVMMPQQPNLIDIRQALMQLPIRFGPGGNPPRSGPIIPRLMDGFTMEEQIVNDDEMPSERLRQLINDDDEGEGFSPLERRERQNSEQSRDNVESAAGNSSQLNDRTEHAKAEGSANGEMRTLDCVKPTIDDQSINVMEHKNKNENTADQNKVITDMNTNKDFDVSPSVSENIEKISTDSAGVPDHPEPNPAGHPDPDHTGQPLPDHAGHPDLDHAGHPETDHAGRPELDCVGHPEPDPVGHPEPEHVAQNNDDFVLLTKILPDDKSGTNTEVSLNNTVSPVSEYQSQGVSDNTNSESSNQNTVAEVSLSSNNGQCAESLPSVITPPPSESIKNVNVDEVLSLSSDNKEEPSVLDDSVKDDVEGT